MSDAGNYFYERPSTTSGAHILYVLGMASSYVKRDDKTRAELAAS